jgi:hypothetical protein
MKSRDSRDLRATNHEVRPGALLAKDGVSEVIVVMNQKIKALFAAAGAALLSTGCYATAGGTTDVEYATTGGVAEVGYVEVNEAPIVIDVQTYPHTYYEGHNVYFYQDRWYYQDGPRWAYYRHEPQVLYRQRGYVQQAPPARYEGEVRERRAREEQAERGRREQAEHAREEQQERGRQEQQEHARREQNERREQQERGRQQHEEQERREHAQPPPRPRVQQAPAIPQRPGPRPGPRRDKR